MEASEEQRLRIVRTWTVWAMAGATVALGLAYVLAIAAFGHASMGNPVWHLRLGVFASTVAATGAATFALIKRYSLWRKGLDSVWPFLVGAAISLSSWSLLAGLLWEEFID